MGGFNSVLTRMVNGSAKPVKLFMETTNGFESVFEILLFVCDLLPVFFFIGSQ